jgi:hypothetical protein
MVNSYWCVDEVPFCITYYFSDQIYYGCTECQEGYYEFKNNTVYRHVFDLCVERIIPNCKNYQKDGSCAECKGNRIEDSETNNRNCVCSQGYVGANEADASCYEAIPNCEKYYFSEYEFRCDACIANYIEFAGSCFKETTNCIWYFEGLGCTECSEKFILVNDIEGSVKCIPEIKDCTTYNKQNY